MDVIDRISEILVENGVLPANAEKITNSVRHEYGGEMVYVPKRSHLYKEAIMRDLRTSGNFKLLAKEHRVHYNTVRRMAKKLRRSK
ncbi:Mor transcription activator family protein [uncultured Paraglaciecola sp.]|uniref:Mor transcription activator family protein n=1 Tax=uncultured Paraglaciecola sp. TaxID=1765024 RepID=UPI00261BFF94|nr:Mor transcription activator family protein [uncultured Paraglaciecola sp.]